MWQFISINNHTNHYLICKSTNSNKNMSHQTFVRFFIIRFNVINIHKSFYYMHYGAIYVTIFFNAKETIVHTNNGMSSACIKTADNISLSVQTYWKLCLVSIVKRTIVFISLYCQLFHTNNGLHFKIFYATDSLNIVVNFFLFKLQLLLVIHCL